MTIKLIMKTAIVHDWFTTYAGSERCVESFTNIWKDADIFSLVDFLNEKDRKIILKGKHAKTTFVQNLPFAIKTAFRTSNMARFRMPAIGAER